MPATGKGTEGERRNKHKGGGGRSDEYTSIQHYYIIIIGFCFFIMTTEIKIIQLVTHLLLLEQKWLTPRNSQDIKSYSHRASLCSPSLASLPYHRRRFTVRIDQYHLPNETTICSRHRHTTGGVCRPAQFLQVWCSNL